MRRYETIFIADPACPEDDLVSFRESFAGAIAERDGQVIQEEDWGNRKLAYEVAKRREGHYVRFEYACEDGHLPAELERRLRISESIIKFLTIRIDNDKKRLVWEKKQAERAVRRAADAAARAQAAAESADDSPAVEASAAEPRKAAAGEAPVAAEET